MEKVPSGLLAVLRAIHRIAKQTNTDFHLLVEDLQIKIKGKILYLALLLKNTGK